MRSAIVRLGCCALAVCVLGACASLTEQDIYEWHERSSMAFAADANPTLCDSSGAHVLDFWVATG